MTTGIWALLYVFVASVMLYVALELHLLLARAKYNAKDLGITQSLSILLLLNL